jgi:hypothetical protein
MWLTGGVAPSSRVCGARPPALGDAAHAEEEALLCRCLGCCWLLQHQSPFSDPASQHNAFECSQKTVQARPGILPGPIARRSRTNTHRPRAVFEPASAGTQQQQSGSPALRGAGTPIAAASKSAPAPAPAKDVKLYYHTDWSSGRVHGSIGGGPWLDYPFSKVGGAWG